MFFSFSGSFSLILLTIFSLTTTFSIHLARKMYFLLCLGFRNIFLITFLLLLCVQNYDQSSFGENYGHFLKFWLVLGGFVYVFSQSETICIICTRVTEKLYSFLSQSGLGNFFVYIISFGIPRVWTNLPVICQSRLWVYGLADCATAT